MKEGKLRIPPYYRGRETSLVILAAERALDVHGVREQLLIIERDALGYAGAPGAVRPPSGAVGRPVEVSVTERGYLGPVSRCTVCQRPFGRGEWCTHDGAHFECTSGPAKGWLDFRAAMGRPGCRAVAPREAWERWLPAISREWDRSNDGCLLPPKGSWSVIDAQVADGHNLARTGRDGWVTPVGWELLTPSQWASVIPRPERETKLTRRRDGSFEGPSKKASVCSACGGDVRVGEPIVWEPGRRGGRVYHRACHGRVSPVELVRAVMEAMQKGEGV